MLYSYNLLQSYIKQKLPSAKCICEMLNRCLGDTSFSKVKADYVFDVELSPNRIGALSGHRHMALELCAMFDLDFKATNDYKLKKPKKLIPMSVKNQAKKTCECYFGIVLDDVKIKESPKFIKDALENCGMKPINNVVDITNYVMLDLGQPMHAFDYTKIKGSKIVVRNARKDEKITVLTGDQYLLDEDVMVIANEEDAMAIAGIKGGINAEINSSTKTIVLESANFKNTNIYRTSKKLKLTTDASVRFSHSISSHITKQALKRAVELLEKYADAKIASKELVANELVEKNNVIPFNLERVNQLIGQEIPLKDMQRILIKLGYKIKKISSNLWNLTVPLYRLNVLIFEDVVDDIVRIYGLDNLKLIPPKVELSAVKNNEFFDFKETVKNIAVSLGLNEVYNYSFINHDDLNILPDWFNEKVFGPKNCLSLNYKYMNPLLAVPLIKNVATNLSNFDSEKIFQLDKTYLSEENIVKENTFFGFTLYNLGKKIKEKEMLLEGKGIIETMLEKLSVSNSQYYFSDKANGYYGCLNVLFKTLIFLHNNTGETVGYLGIVNDKIKAEYKIKNDQKNPLVIVGELDMTKLYKMVDYAMDFKPIPKYPTSIKDISVLVESNVLIQDVILSILNLKINDLKDIDLFDVYDIQDDGKKSLSFHLIFRNENKTLELEEIEGYLKLINESLTKLGYIIR